MPSPLKSVQYLSLSLSPPLLTRSLSQELITFPPIQLSPSVRQALMVPRSGDVSLPESKPNPSLDPLGDEYSSASHALDGNGSGNGSNGFNKLKLRVPMERRYRPISFISSFYHPIPHFQGTTQVPTASTGPQRSRTTTNVSPNCSSISRVAMTQQ